MLSACLPGQLTEQRTRSATPGYPGVRIQTTQSCLFRLDGATGGWIALWAVSASPAAGVDIVDATVTGLPGTRQWHLATNPSVLTTTPQQYDLWKNGASLPEVLTAEVSPGETFRVTYAVGARDLARNIPAGNERVGVRVLDAGNHPLTLVKQSCDTGSSTVVPGIASHLTTVDMAAGQAAQTAAIANGLVLPPAGDFVAEFLRVLEGPCGMEFGSTELPDPLADFVILQVDHGADVTVGVIGDSITSQTRDELVADTRYNWVVASFCASRMDHFLGRPILPDLADLSFGLFAVLASGPDVAVVAMGSADTLHLPGRDHTPEINDLLTGLDGVPCTLAMNLYASDMTNTTWRNDMLAFNSQLDTVAAAHHVPVIDWDTAARAAGSGPNHPWLLPAPFDLVHMSVPVGHRARVGMLLDAIDTCVER